MPAWLIPLIVSVALQAAVYLITPKPKGPKPTAAQMPQAPTADAGRPILRFWGTMTIKSPNVLWYGESAARQFKIKV